MTSNGSAGSTTTRPVTTAGSCASTVSGWRMWPSTSSGDTLDDRIRPVKQWQAWEESRDLSRVTIRGLLSKVHRDLPRGARLGGFPPHGYDLRYRTEDDRFRFVVRYLRDGAKLLLDEVGAETGRRPRREPHIVSKRDRCFLTPSEDRTTPRKAVSLGGYR